MKQQSGDMWSVTAGLTPKDLFCVTTNAQVRKKDGALVMGRGIALEAAQRYPGLQQEAGRRITEHLALRARLGRPDRFYGLLVIRAGTVPGLDFHLGLFQVKDHWKDEASPGLIASSARRLHAALSPSLRLRAIHSPWAGGVGHLNYPGIGNGRLTPEIVAPCLLVLKDLPVTLWRKP